MSFSTIRFYIILKPALTPYDMEKRFSTIRFYIILKLPFGYGRHKSGFSTIRFYIILKLIPFCDALFFSFQYHTFLHHSQTAYAIAPLYDSFSTIRFYIILKLHFYSPFFVYCFSTIRFYIILKPSNSKMNRHHLRKTRYSNTFNRFHIDLYL